MKLNLLILFIVMPALLTGQEILDEYVRYGIENNLALQQKQASYRKSLEALREARGLFYPNISFNARYSLAEGGRAIDFPVGDLLNPVYSTLNKLTSSDLFPVLENEEIYFMRPREHETKLRLVQPVFNRNIYYNSRIRKEMSLFESEDVNQYRRELVAEIKKAYYNVACSQEVISIYVSTRRLLVENIRVNKKLIENGRVTKDYLYRSEAELNKFDQEFQHAENSRKLASSYFNFLLNRPLGDSIVIELPSVFPSLADLNNNYIRRAADTREEVRKLTSYSNISELKLKKEQSARLPELFIAVDYGFQGTEYRFNKNQDYVLASAVLSWNIFSGFQNRYRISQSEMEKSMTEKKLEEAKKQIELQVTGTMDDLRTAEKGISVAGARLTSAREGFRLVSRRYDEGQASLIEFIDARSAMTKAEENLVISRFDYLSCFAEFEKVAAINKIE
jgi:outer membrane protein